MYMASEIHSFVPIRNLKSNVLVITGDPLGELMAGPAIRAWNISNVLAEYFNVILASFSSVSLNADHFEIISLSMGGKKLVKTLERWADIIIVQGYPLLEFPVLASSTKCLIVDIYDPLHLEDLAQSEKNLFQNRKESSIDATATLNHQLLLGDFFICSSERQRFFWLGQLAALGRINPQNYDKNKNLDGLIAEVPFGISEVSPSHNKQVLREVIPGISQDDFILIWAGGLYDWFDPMTLIEAVGIASKENPKVKLFFMGTQHPNPNVPEMPIVAASKAYAKQLGLLDNHVFFNESWVPFNERANYLLESDVGVTTHFQHLETTFSFRTRVLDYLWASLPILTTKGDSFAELVEQNNLGKVVEEQNALQLSQAIIEMVSNPQQMQIQKNNIRLISPSFHWRNVLQPLVQYCMTSEPSPDRKLNFLGNRRVIPSIPGQKRTPLKRATNLVDRILYFVRRGEYSILFEKVKSRILKIYK